MSSLPQPLPHARRATRAETIAGLSFVAILAGWGFLSGWRSADIRPVSSRDVQIAAVAVHSPQPQAQPLPRRPVPLGLDTPAAQALADQARPPVTHPVQHHDERPTALARAEEPPPTALAAGDAGTDVSAVEAAAPPPATDLIAPPVVRNLRPAR
jgi:hypothetical protein